MEYRVALTSLKTAPAIQPNGAFVQAAMFRITEVGTGRARNVDGGWVGGETLERCQRLAQLGSIVLVAEPGEFPLDSHEWQVKTIDAALLRTLG